MGSGLSFRARNRRIPFGDLQAFFKKSGALYLRIVGFFLMDERRHACIMLATLLIQIHKLSLALATNPHVHVERLSFCLLHICRHIVFRFRKPDLLVFA